MDHQVDALKAEMGRKDSYIKTQQENVNTLQARIKAYEQQKRVREDRKETSLKENDAIRKLFRLAEEERNLPTDVDWQAVSHILCKKYPAFRELRNIENLTKDEYRVCMLCKLSMSIKKMAFLTGKSDANLSMIRKRLLTKVFNVSKGGAPEFDRRIRAL